MRAKREQARAEKMVREWNEKHGVGQGVIVQRDDGTATRTTTRSEAQVLGGHTAVIWLEGIAGCFALDRVTAIP